MIARPSFLYVWVPLGLAAYCFATLIADARQRDWGRTEAIAVSVVETGGPVVVRDTLGRPKTRWTSGPAVLGYRYRVDGRSFRGYWNGSLPPLEPVTVLYDPEHPERSTLETPQAGAAFHAVGWTSLALGLTAFGLRRRRRERSERTAPPDAGPAPGGLGRTAFRLLVLLDLAILAARQGIPSAVDRLPVEVWNQIDRHLPPGPLQEMFADLFPAALLLSLIASLGLLTFWRPARQLYLLTWCWWLLGTWLADAGIEYGFEGFLGDSGQVLGGAILALSFYSPIVRAFEARPPSEEGTERGTRRGTKARPALGREGGGP